MASEEQPQCGSGRNNVDLLGLRVASLFIIGACTMLGTFFPILAKRSKFFKVPPVAYDFAKYFGSGVIIATAFIHLLAPAMEALGSECLTGTWTSYPWALAISMASVFGIFFLELTAFRWGSNILNKIGFKVHDAHGHDLGNEGAYGAHGPEVASTSGPAYADVEHGGALSYITECNSTLPSDGKHITDEPRHLDTQTTTGILDSGITQIVGIAILEFGVVLHSILIGLTLAVDEGFKILFVVLVFHQTFEGLGLGARLAFMPLAPGYAWVPIAGALAFALSTPLGIAVGLGVRSTYNPESTRALIVSGILDSVSSGILLYTGLVELLAHEFLFNPAMHNISNGRLAFASVSMLVGAGLMALLGRWA